MTVKIKHIYRIYNTETKEWLSYFAIWSNPHIVWDEKITRARKWPNAKSISEFFLAFIENKDVDFNEIPETWEIRAVELIIETNEQEHVIESANKFIYQQVRWPHLSKFWSNEKHEWMLKAAINDLSKTFDAKFAITFTSGYHNSTWNPSGGGAGKLTTTETFDVTEVRSLLIKAKKRMTGKMRVILRYRTVFVENETDLTIVKMMLNEHIRFIIDMDTGLDPAGREIDIDDNPF